MSHVEPSGEKKPARVNKRETAVAALLTEATHQNAAKKAGISYATLKRWLKEDSFVEAYRASRQAVLDGAINALVAGMGDAAEALKRNLTCGKPAAEIRAATALISLAMH